MSINSFKTTNLFVAGYKKDPVTQLVSSIDLYDGDGNIYTIQDDASAQNAKTVVMSYNGEITVNPDAPYTSIDSVTVKVNVPLGKELYAWKHSSDIIYTKTLLKKSGTVEVVKLPLANDTATYNAAEPEKTVSIWKDGVSFINADGSASTEPSGTAGSPVDIGDYVTDATFYYKKSDTAEQVTHNIWKIGSTFYNGDMTVGTEPSGTAGSSTNVGSVYQATSSDTHLTEDAFYTVETVGGTDHYYLATGFATTGVNHGEDEITDADALTELGAATFNTLVLVPYEEDVYSYFKVLNFGTTEVTTTLATKPVMDADIIAVLQADTPSEIDYVPYTIAAVDESLVFNSDTYERYEAGDYEM